MIGNRLGPYEIIEEIGAEAWCRRPAIQVTSSPSGLSQQNDRKTIKDTRT